MNQAVGVSVVLALPDRQQVVELQVPPGTTARQAVHLAFQAGLDFSGSGVDPHTVPLGIYAERVEDDTPLSANDRVELYRALQQHPMELRRKRAASGGGIPARRK